MLIRRSWPFLYLAWASTLQDNGTNVEWALECSSRCQDVEHALGLLGQVLENAIALAPIRIQVYFDSFCQSSDGCRPAEIARCEMAEVFQAHGGVTFISPQALIKQQGPSDFDDHDMAVFINADKDFYFPRDYPVQQRKTQYDFMTVLAHEVVHGLGFTSSLGTYIPHLVSPLPKTHVETWFFMTVFDKGIVLESKATSLAYYAGKLKELGPVVNYRESISPHHEIFKTLTAATNSPDELYFLTACGKRVRLGSSLLTGATPSHLDVATYRESTDAGMVFSTSQGEGIHHLFASAGAWATSPFGPDTLAILATLGYRLNPHPSPERSLQAYYAKARRGPR